MQEKNRPPREISRNLSRVLDRTGWSQVRLAEAIGVNPVTVNRWIKKNRKVDYEYIVASAEALGVTVEELTGPYPAILSNTGEDAPDVPLPDEPSAAEWKRRALAAEAKLKHLQEACSAMGQHVEALGCTVRHFGSIISG